MSPVPQPGQLPLRRVVRIIALASCLAGAIAVDVPPVPPPSPVKDAAATPGSEVPPNPHPPALQLQPALISVAAKQGGTMSFKPEEPSRLLGGVRLGYEEVFVLCDHVDYWQSKIPGLKRPTLDHALIASGPEAEEPEHVVFDSKASKLPQLAFRGVMKPRMVEIIRQPPELKPVPTAGETVVPSPPSKDDVKPVPPPPPKDGAKPPPVSFGLVRFRVLLHQLGDFDGDLHTTNGWAPHFGWADEAEAIMIGDLLPDGVANPRFATIIMHGRPAAPGQDKRLARLGRRHIALAEPAAKKQLGAEAYDWWAESSEIIVDFDDQGRVLRIRTGADYRGEGTPSLDTPVHRDETPPPATK